MVKKSRSYSLTEIAEKFGLTLQLKSKTQEPDSIFVKGIATLAGAGSTDIAFLANPRYRSQLLNSQALVVILHPSMAENCKAHCLLSENPYLSYAKLTQLFVKRTQEPYGVHVSAVVDASTKLGKHVRIGAGVVVGEGVSIGDGCEINANVVIESGVRIGQYCKVRSNATLCYNVRLGDGVIIQAGAIIGSEGFGFAPFNDTDNQLHWQSIAQLGTVVIGNRVEIGANTTIDRGALENTCIEDDVIIDNQVQIAHNVSIGQGTAIAGCVGIAGSTKIGKHCSIGGGAGIAGHLSIADGTTIMGMALINRSVKKAGVYASGTGMQEAVSWRKSAVRFTQLELMNQRLKALEKQLKTTQQPPSTDT